MAALKRWLPLSLVIVMSAGCFHQVVQTGRSPSATVIDKPWVSTWIFGLVEAQPIESRPACSTGIATVETETSFPNGLVSVLTLGIYTPQHVRITCAINTSSLPIGARQFTIPAGASLDEARDVLGQAIRESASLHEPVVLHFSH